MKQLLTDRYKGFKEKLNELFYYHSGLIVGLLVAYSFTGGNVGADKIVKFYVFMLVYHCVILLISFLRAHFKSY